MIGSMPSLALPLPRRLAPRPGPVMLFLAVAAAVFILPPALFGYLSYRQFEFFRFTSYIPHEAFFADLRSGEAARIFHSALFTANMTSGLPIANMFTLTLGQLGLSLGLALAIALNVSAVLAARRATQPANVAVLVSAVGLSLAATAAASSTGLVGCHPGLAGGLVTLLGVGSQTAARLATLSPAIQAALVGLLLLSWARLRR
jgi:hypothetical protein